MKKIVSLLIVLLVFYNVNADLEPPKVIKHEVVIANKDGASCYQSDSKGYSKMDKSIPYGNSYYVSDEVVNNKYVFVYSDSDDTSCLVLLSDIKVKNNNFDIKSDGVQKIEESRAIILAERGLNLRKGPAMSYSKIITIPQYSIVTIKYKAGSYWYYAEYNGYKGWISGINQYFGYDESDILYDIVDINIYNDNKKIIGTIPKYTEITNYVRLVQYNTKIDYKYYVNYNGIKGYILDMSNKVDGELKLLTDAYIYNGNKVIDKITKNDTVSYTVHKPGKQVGIEPSLIDYIFYVPSKNGTLKLRNDSEKKEFITIKENNAKKLSGYIGEGLFGEVKEEKESIKEKVEDINKIEEEKEEKQNKSNIDIIIISVLSCIIGALTCFVVILLVNAKKNKRGDLNEKK